MARRATTLCGLAALIALSSCTGGGAAAPARTPGTGADGTTVRSAVDPVVSQPVTSPPGTDLNPPLGSSGVTPGVSGVAPASTVPPTSYATPSELKALGIDATSFDLLRPDGMGAMRFGDSEPSVLGILAEGGAGSLRRRVSSCGGGTYDVLEFDDLLTAFDRTATDTPMVGYRFRRNRGGPAPLTTAGSIHIGSTVREATAALGAALTVAGAAAPGSPDPVRAGATAIGTITGAPAGGSSGTTPPTVRLLLSGPADDDRVVAIEAGLTCPFDAPS